MKTYLEIVADTNDGDYISNRILVTEEQLELIKPVVEAIKNFQPYNTEVNSYKRKHDNNYPIGDCQRKDLGEKSAEDLYGHLPGFQEFDEMCPHAEYGIHTINTVSVIVVQEEYRLL